MKLTSQIPSLTCATLAGERGAEVDFLATEADPIPEISEPRPQPIDLSARVQHARRGVNPFFRWLGDGTSCRSLRCGGAND